MLLDRERSIRTVIIDCGSVNFIDSQGTAQISGIARLTREAGLELQLARVKGAVAVVLDRDGCLDLIGRDHLHGNVDQAVRAIRRDGGDAAD